MKKLITCIAVLLALGASFASAEVYEFKFNALEEEPDLTNGVPPELIEAAHTIGELQFRMVVDIADPDAGFATFSFYNLGEFESALTQVGFDTGTNGFALNLDNVINDLTPGHLVNYTGSDVPPFVPPFNPASTNYPGWTWSTDILASPVSPEYLYGVQNSTNGYFGAEVLTLEMSYGLNTDLLALLVSGDVRIVTKIQGVEFNGEINTDVSEFFVNGGYVVIPEPASVVLLVGAGSLIGIIRRRFID